jgi:uncharacterized membrane protein
MFFLPGFAWTLVFFTGKQVNIVERIALSFGLSIAMVTLAIFASNWLVGIKITGTNSLFIIVVLTLIPLAYYCVKRFLIRP